MGSFIYILGAIPGFFWDPLLGPFWMAFGIRFGSLPGPLSDPFRGALWAPWGIPFRVPLRDVILSGSTRKSNVFHRSGAPKRVSSGPLSGSNFGALLGDLLGALLESIPGPFRDPFWDTFRGPFRSLLGSLFGSPSHPLWDPFIH